MTFADNIFTFNARPSDSPFVDLIWHTHSGNISDEFVSTASMQWEMVIMKQYGATFVTVRGPETIASSASIPHDAEFLGIRFKIGTFMPHLPVNQLADSSINLPFASSRNFWLAGDSWELPTFENADTFLHRLVRHKMLDRDPLVEVALHNQPHDVSLRTLQRRFLKATGLTQGTFQQIERAQHALTLLLQGVSILDTVYLAGYADQPHLTRSLKRFIGQTPAQILQTQLA